MTGAAIEVEGLGKRYRIGIAESAPTTLAKSVRSLVGAPLQYLRSSLREPSEEETLWALRDVSFEVERGDVVGVIGRNGAGKSTLLKILSRITEPTTGRAVVRGRVGSLLEVGTGFHPELTGRENIYLSGTMLGMTRREVSQRFDEIVAFAETERFLDTPVKRYSSGMYVRLAFGVAAHLESEIMMVDEVLAVGDAEFQRKCIGKMGDVSRQGRTILFVSHNMGAVSALCRRAIVLQDGCVVADGGTRDAVNGYLQGEDASTQPRRVVIKSPRAMPIGLEECWVADAEGELASVVSNDRLFRVVAQIYAERLVRDAEVSMRFHNEYGNAVFTTNWSDRSRGEALRLGRNVLAAEIPAQFLAAGRYSVTIGIHVPGVIAYDVREHALSFRVEDGGSNMWRYSGHRYGDVLTDFPWRRLEAVDAG